MGVEEVRDTHDFSVALVALFEPLDFLCAQWSISQDEFVPPKLNATTLGADTSAGVGTSGLDPRCTTTHMNTATVRTIIASSSAHITRGGGGCVSVILLRNYGTYAVVPSSPDLQNSERGHKCTRIRPAVYKRESLLPDRWR